MALQLDVTVARVDLIHSIIPPNVFTTMIAMMAHTRAIDDTFMVLCFLLLSTGLPVSFLCLCVSLVEIE